MPQRKFHSVKRNEGQFIYPIHFILNSIHEFLQILDVTSQKAIPLQPESKLVTGSCVYELWLKESQKNLNY